MASVPANWNWWGSRSTFNDSELDSAAFTDSRDYHARRRQRDRMIAIGSAAAAVFLGVAVVAVLFYEQAQRAEQHAITEQEQAERARDTAQANLQRFYRARYNEIVPITM